VTLQRDHAIFKKEKRGKFLVKVRPRSPTQKEKKRKKEKKKKKKKRQENKKKTKKETGGRWRDY